MTAHLLIPGYTHTGMTAPKATNPAEKPDAAWSAEQVVDFMLEEIEAGYFYILCADNEPTRAVTLAPGVERRLRAL